MRQAAPQPHSENSISTDHSNTHAPTLPVSPELLISLATGPMLLGILSAKSLSEFVQQIGVASEEIFRGDRLPVLTMPIPKPENNHDS
ncbi:MAG: hypothetical protein QNJ46_33405 [Leptolyngbyaceae cyanobacterium MO_188.B28]|nr:hypothetical protein [Leptolyngbyaceae cyanobacterium MO_188.B28]